MPASFVVETEDIEYARPDGKALLARLYKPRGPGPFPGVVEVHGGAWTSNDRLTNTPIHQPLAESGVVVMAIDFRMPPDAGYPAALRDINAAIRWLKTNAEAQGTRADLIGLLGTSSGGHQAMLTALRPDAPDFLPEGAAGDIDTKVAFVALCWAVLDPLARYRMVQEKGVQRLIDAHHAYWPSIEAMEQGNPQLILGRDEPSERPPALLLQGTKDDNLTPDMADRFAAAYRAAGGEITLEKFDGEPHAFIAKDPQSPALRRAIEMIIAFVHEKAGPRR